MAEPRIIASTPHELSNDKFCEGFKTPAKWKKLGAPGALYKKYK